MAGMLTASEVVTTSSLFDPATSLAVSSADKSDGVGTICTSSGITLGDDRTSSIEHQIFHGIDLVRWIGLVIEGDSYIEDGFLYQW